MGFYDTSWVESKNTACKAFSLSEIFKIQATTVQHLPSF